MINMDNQHPQIKNKTRSGASLKKSEQVPPFPEGEQLSGSQDKPKYADNPETNRENKGKPGRPASTQPTNQVPPVTKRT